MAGILIGPCGLDLIPKDLIGHMGFVSDLALAFIAFGVGKFFKKEVIKKTGPKIIVITMFEALMAGFLVTVCALVFFHLDLDFALILGAIATATAPASTMMTINQYKAKGEFVNVLLQIVALDDVVCLMAFSIVAAVARRDVSQAFSMSEVMMPIAYNLMALGLGFFCGYFLSRLLIPARSRDNPVSYTHLDVYKRQQKDRAACIYYEYGESVCFRHNPCNLRTCSAFDQL